MSSSGDSPDRAKICGRSNIASGTSRLDGVIDAVTSVLSDGTTTAERVHMAIARKPFAALRLAPAGGAVPEVVRVTHDGIAALAYAGLRAGFRTLAAAARAATRLGGLDGWEPAAGSPGDMAISALNGFAGDRLEREGNALASPMSLRHRGRAVDLERAALAATYPEAAPRLVVFVHGLACNETMWDRAVQRHRGGVDASYGSRLQRDLAYTPLYLRYNTGLPIAENGRRLSALLDRLVAEWPQPVEELALVGHSMGGLVIRSAAHHGADRAWAGQVRHVIYLASPHLGAPLEKAANVAGWLLGLSDTTRPFADLVNQRSRGIKDLRFGAVRDEDWPHGDVDAVWPQQPDDVPLLAGAAHYFISATATRDSRHPLGIVLGDLLVREVSASGRGRWRHIPFAPENGRHFGGITHLELLNHPEVYEQIRDWLAAS